MEINHSYGFANDLGDIGQAWIDQRDHGDTESITFLLKKQTFDVCERLEALLTELQQFKERDESGITAGQLCDRLDEIVDELRSHNAREELRDAG